MSQNNPEGNNNINKPRRTSRTSTTSTSNTTNRLNLKPPTFTRGLGQQGTTGQVIPVSSSNLLSGSSSNLLSG